VLLISSNLRGSHAATVIRDIRQFIGSIVGVVGETLNPLLVGHNFPCPVVLPKGEWEAENGTIHTGGTPIKIEAPLQRLPYSVKKRRGDSSPRGSRRLLNRCPGPGKWGNPGKRKYRTGRDPAFQPPNAR
jgi:hypothetical protein